MIYWPEVGKIGGIARLFLGSIRIISVGQSVVADVYFLCASSFAKGMDRLNISSSLQVL